MSNWISDFGLAEAAAKRRREQTKIANQQAAFLGQQRGQRNLAEIQKRYTEGFQPQVASFGRRGLGGPSVQSGIRTKGLERYAESLQRDLGAETQSLQDELTRIQLNEAQSQADLEDYLAQLRLDKQKSILQDALNIKTLASY